MTDGSQEARAPEPSRPVPPRSGSARPRVEPAPDPTPRSTSKGTPRSTPAPRSPNFAARRMLVTTIGITAVVAAGVFGWRMLRDEPESVVADGEPWNQVVLIDRGTGAVSAITAGDVSTVAAQAQATGRVTAVHVEGGRVALVQAGQITLTGLDDIAPAVIPIEPEAVVTRVPVDDALWLAVATSAGNVILIDGLTGTTIDVAALAGQAAPRYFVDTMRFDPNGSRFAIADAVNGQTIVVAPSADPPTATFFPDIPVAVGEELVVTSQVVGQQADLSLLDAERATLAKVSVELPIGGVLVDDEVTIVSTEGTVSRFGPDDTEAERLGSVAVPPGATIQSVRLTAGGTRFVVAGPGFEAVVDLDGKTVFTTTFPTPVDLPVVDPGWTCLPVGGGTTYTSIVDLASGETLVELTGVEVTAIAGDGCTVLATRGSVTEVIGVGGTAQLGQVRSATLAPDGRAVVVQTSTSSLQLIPIEDGALQEPLDLTPLAPSNPIVAFRDG